MLWVQFSLNNRRFNLAQFLKLFVKLKFSRVCIDETYRVAKHGMAHIRCMCLIVTLQKTGAEGWKARLNTVMVDVQLFPYLLS